MKQITYWRQFRDGRVFEDTEICDKEGFSMLLKWCRTFSQLSSWRLSWNGIIMAQSRDDIV